MRRRWLVLATSYLPQPHLIPSLPDVADHMYTGVAQAYVLDPEVQAFVRQANPWALRDMAERLLEANQRGLWASADEAMLDALRQVANEAEGVLETR